MSIEFHTELGISISLPDGSVAVLESSAGPSSQQFSLVNGDVVSLIRDERTFSTLAEIIAWTQGMASYYVTEFGAVEEMQGTLQSLGKESYAYSVTFNDTAGVPRRATLIGILCSDVVFAGVTLLTINAGAPLDLGLVQEIVDGVTVSQDSSDPQN